ncbi:cob(I)yrinic acid a,c-diamide adenosyltransferase [Thermococcus celer]|uniref:Cob(I)yrinic acid a,c-diamide adenosyltransferase n=1 Tax=Thermococcus celer Vu 13 = JCM 8558 TaxID=1293037 RepID=A0A218P3C9_THECE|nr:cob(I)yrinic acid a,c-diamide adenosyltransferase [Thermococcus celer]ASI99425.1 cob(I)yrinic acid a,c-diamide adenosyltransferase [Thermococcus celer Vu 13 = JCM 8558]
MSWKEKLGLVHIYTGNGKGKTTAALGLAVRMLGSDGKVMIIQFMKAPRVYGEQRKIEECGARIESFGLPKFVHGKPEPDDIEAAQKALQRAKEVVSSGEWDLVILDELCVALGFGMLDVGEVEEMIKNRAPHTELVLTGRYCPEGLFELADYVTEMREVKHPYGRGILARRGVEF